VGEELDRSEEQGWEAEKSTHHPDNEADPAGPGWFSSPALGRQGTGQHQVPVHTHQRKEQDAAVVVHPNDNVYQLTHKLTKWPMKLLYDRNHPEGQAGHHEEVCSSQVPQVDVCHCAVSLLEAEHTQHEGVAYHSQQADDGHVNWLDGVHPIPGCCVVTLHERVHRPV
uniref:Uncharacterized protein n=1 Tax=Salmo trutta TaxID=8032 RepID=A0A674BN41_SALTR